MKNKDFEGNNAKGNDSKGNEANASQETQDAKAKDLEDGSESNDGAKPSYVEAETDKNEYRRELIRKNLNNVIRSGYIPELGEHRQGKVRDIHFQQLGKPLYMVASDRVSAYDHVLSRCIPFKGMILNLLNNWAFENTKDIVPNAQLPSPHPNVIVQKNLKNIMVECVVRGFVWGSLAGAYEKGERELCGLRFPPGLLRYQELSEPIFTPTTKADEHDEPMTFKEVQEMLGEETAKQVKDYSIRLFKRGQQLAKDKGLILIDTKYEFGLDKDGKLYLIDEANTPDSSRYCTIEEYRKYPKICEEMQKGNHDTVSELLKDRPELKIKELSKQFVRDVLTEKGFSYGSTGPIPELTDEDVVEVSSRYIELYEMLTANEFRVPEGPVRFELLHGLKEEGHIKGGLAVIMAGSDSDKEHILKIRSELDKWGLRSVVRICSAHKQPGKCREIIEGYNKSLEPLAIIAIAGGTDALSGLASYHSVYPVVSCPPGEPSSCLANPPGSSNSTIVNPSNVARHTAQILGMFAEDIKDNIRDTNKKKEDSLSEKDEEWKRL